MGVGAGGAGQLAIDLREIGQGEGGAHVDAPVAHGAVEAGGDVAAAQRQALEGQGFAAARHRAGEARLPADQPVGDRVAEGEFRGTAGEDGTGEGLRGIAGEACRDIALAREGAAGEAGEGGETQDVGLDLALQHLGAGAAGEGQRHVGRRDREVGDLRDRLLVDDGAQLQHGAAAEGLRHAAVRQRKAVDLAIHDDAVAFRAGALGLRGDHGGEGADLRAGTLKPLQVELALDPRRGEVAHGGGVEDETFDARGAAGRRPAGVRQGPRAGGDIEFVAGGEIATDRQLGELRSEAQALDGIAAVVAEDDAALQRRVAGEDGRHRRRQQALDTGAEVEAEAADLVVAGQNGVAAGVDVGTGVEGDAAPPVVEAPRAGDVELHRRQSRQVAETRGDAAGRLIVLQRQVELLAGRDEGQLDGGKAGRVGAAHLEGGVEAFRGSSEAGGTTRGEPRRHAEHRFSQHELGDGELADLDLQRQLRQQGTVGRRWRRRWVRYRLAQQLDLADLEVLDLQPPRQQRGAAPDEADGVDAQIDALPVGDGDVADHRIGGEWPFDRADAHRRSGRGQRARDEAGEDALIFLRVRPRRRQQQHGGPDQKGQDGESGDGAGARQHQKACPMLT